MIQYRTALGLWMMVCLVSPAVAADVALRGAWSGEYRYPADAAIAMPAVKFDMRFAHVGDRFTGRVSETNTFGENPNDARLFADCTGTVEQTTRKVSWTKTYDGTSNVRHSVEYTGTVSEDGREIEGTWTLDGLSGTFSLKRADKGAVPSKLRPSWSGTYEYPDGSGQPAVPFGMEVAEIDGKFTARTREPNTFGENPAKNPSLFADVRGTFDPTTRKVSWTKTYDGTANARHSVEYTGTVSEDGQTIEGTWTLDGLTGPFTLKRSTANEV